jgi:hypothetical protein
MYVIFIKLPEVCKQALIWRKFAQSGHPDVHIMNGTKTIGKLTLYKTLGHVKNTKLAILIENTDSDYFLHNWSQQISTQIFASDKSWQN